mmetsp:Transcript_41738/g.82087  ORF Transcript_41738/g.82087 Transcript_41738/m.82087 type:complete len:235 (+) Transcript_41738:802-1506(+)
MVQVAVAVLRDQLLRRFRAHRHHGPHPFHEQRCLGGLLKVKVEPVAHLLHPHAPFHHALLPRLELQVQQSLLVRGPLPKLHDGPPRFPPASAVFRGAVGALPRVHPEFDSRARLKRAAPVWELRDVALHRHPHAHAAAVRLCPLKPAVHEGELVFGERVLEALLEAQRHELGGLGIHERPLLVVRLGPSSLMGPDFFAFLAHQKMWVKFIQSLTDFVAFTDAARAHIWSIGLYG